jgi:hypothetical protein
MIHKFTSRKFWVAIITIICGILGVFNVADGTIEVIGSMLMILVPGIVYIFAEGKIDAAAVAKQIDIDSFLDQLGELFKDDEDDSAEV